MVVWSYSDDAIEASFAALCKSFEARAVTRMNVMMMMSGDHECSQTVFVQVRSVLEKVTVWDDVPTPLLDSGYETDDFMERVPKMFSGTDERRTYYGRLLERSCDEIRSVLESPGMLYPDATVSSPSR